VTSRTLGTGGVAFVLQTTQTSWIWLELGCVTSIVRRWRRLLQGIQATRAPRRRECCCFLLVGARGNAGFALELVLDSLSPRARTTVQSRRFLQPGVRPAAFQSGSPNRLRGWKRAAAAEGATATARSPPTGVSSAIVGNAWPGQSPFRGAGQIDRWACPVRSPRASTPCRAFSRAGPSTEFEPNQFRALARPSGHGGAGRSSAFTPIGPAQAPGTTSKQSWRSTLTGQRLSLGNQSWLGIQAAGKQALF